MGEWWGDSCLIARLDQRLAEKRDDGGWCHPYLLRKVAPIRAPQARLATLAEVAVVLDARAAGYVGGEGAGKHAER